MKDKKSETPTREPALGSESEAWLRQMKAKVRDYGMQVDDLMLRIQESNKRWDARDSAKVPRRK